MRLSSQDNDHTVDRLAQRFGLIRPSVTNQCSQVNNKNLIYHVNHNMKLTIFKLLHICSGASRLGIKCFGTFFKIQSNC